jgi:hypothetical protein
LRHETNAFRRRYYAAEVLAIIVRRPQLPPGAGEVAEFPVHEPRGRVKERIIGKVDVEIL